MQFLRKHIILTIFISLVIMPQAYACSDGGRGPVTYIPMGNGVVGIDSYQEYLQQHFKIHAWEELPFSYTYKQGFADLPHVMENDYLQITRQPVAENFERVPMLVKLKQSVQSLTIIYETDADLFTYDKYHDLDIQQTCGGWRKNCPHKHSPVFGQLAKYIIGSDVSEIGFHHQQIGLRGRYIYLLEKVNENKEKRTIVSRSDIVYKPYPCSASIIHFYFEH